jgi:predicted nucleic acid-binding protein
MRVFIDSDVVISSLLSSRGAAYILLNAAGVTRIISTASVKELRVVCKRLNIPGDALDALIQKRFMVASIRGKTQDYQIYVTDPNDSHIIAGAVSAKTPYLLSYNLKHFKVEKIKNDLEILLMTPALFLQYMRSH